MFPEEPPREADLLQMAADVITERLPSTWSVAVDSQVLAPSRVQVDGVLTIEPPQGRPITLVVEVKKTLLTGDIPDLVDRLRAAWPESDAGPVGYVLVARWLSESNRDKVRRRDAGYIDATGNVLIACEDPALYISTDGSSKDPWRGPGRPRGTLKGAPAARVARALIDYTEPYTIPEIIERSGASTGATYRVMRFLQEEDLIEREERGQITRVSWRKLLERWGQDYRFDKAVSVRSYLAPRGIESVIEQLTGADPADYVITGSVAAQLDAPYAPPRLLTMYARQPDALAEALDLRPVDQGANVRIAANDDDFALDRGREVDGLTYAARSQVAVDLVSGPGRSPSEASELLDWMERNPDVWRK